MAKRTKKKKSSTGKFHIFLLGIIVGLGLFWLPTDLDFSPTQFSESPLANQSIFQTHLPVTSPYIQHESHVVSYNGRTRNPHWVYHQLTEEVLSAKTSREGCDFKEDPSLPSHMRATKKDYTGSGFDRGHMCAAADCLTQKG